jgi:hypothetical protein
MDKNNSHKTMVQKEERRIRTIHTKQWYKKREAWIRTIHTKQWYKKKRGG